MKPLLILLLALITATTSAQWSIGGRAGVTFSNYKTKTPWKEVTNMGFDVGVIGYKQVKKNIGVNVELHYIQKGYYHKICNSITDELKANYIEIPFMLDYAFIIPSMQNFKAHANLGLYTAYWVSGTYKMKGFDQSTEKFDFSKSNASRFDIGPNAGGRIEYILKNGSLSLDFRYEMGLIDLQKQEQDNTRNTNRAMVVGISYLKLIK